MVNSASIRIRLQRFGAPHKPFYRIVACPRKAPRDGKFYEILGTYNPIPDINGNKQVQLKVDSIKKWVMHGAQPSERVAKILGHAEILPPAPRRYLLKDPALLMEPPAAVEDDADDGESDADAESSDAEHAASESEESAADADAKPPT